MRTRKRAIPFYIATIIYAILIFYLSSQENVGETGANVFSLDKANHLFEYGILGVLLFCSFYLTPLSYQWMNRFPNERFRTLRIFNGKRGKDAFFTFLLGSFYGITDELHQSFVPGRQASIGDFIADSLGVLLGIVVVLLSLRYFSIYRSQYKSQEQQQITEINEVEKDDA